MKCVSLVCYEMTEVSCYGKYCLVYVMDQHTRTAPAAVYDHPNSSPTTVFIFQDQSGNIHRLAQVSVHRASGRKMRIIRSNG